MKEKRIGVAVIGCGEISSYHINALRLIPEAEIRVCCDIKRERAEDAACGGAAVETDYRRAVARDDVDIVFILTPNDSHCEIAVAAANAKKAVFVQKPFARTASECRQMIDAARTNQVRLFVSFMHRYFEETKWAREFLASGGLGEIYLCHIRNSLPGSDYSTWQYEAKKCGPGGAVIDVGVHGIDLVRYLLGDIEEVLYASKGQKILERTILGETIYPDNEDWALAQYRLKSGAIVTHHISWTQKYHCNRYTMEIHGSNGSIYLRTGYGPLAVTSPALAVEGSMVYPPLAAVPFGYKQHRAVIDCMCHGGEVECTGEDGLYTLEMVEKILDMAVIL